MNTESIQHDLEEVTDHMVHPHEPCYESYEVFQDIKLNLLRHLGEVAENGANHA